MMAFTRGAADILKFLKEKSLDQLSGLIEEKLTKETASLKLLRIPGLANSLSDPVSEKVKETLIKSFGAKISERLGEILDLSFLPRTPIQDEREIRMSRGAVNIGPVGRIDALFQHPEARVTLDCNGEGQVTGISSTRGSTLRYQLLPADGLLLANGPPGAALRVKVGDEAAPEVTWTQQPPSSVEAGQTIDVRWEVAGGIEVSRPELRYGTESDPQQLRFASSGRMVSDRVFSVQLRLNPVTFPPGTTIHFVAFATVDRVVRTSKTVSTVVSGPSEPKTFRLTTRTEGNGSGSIRRDKRSPDYPEGTVVELFADPNPDSRFAFWSSACQGSGQCVLTMDADKTVTATFNKVVSPATFRLTINNEGDGGGTVNASPPGPDYPAGDKVTLTATPDSGSTFGGWSGACSGTGACVLTMDADKAVTARFEIIDGGGTGGAVTFVSATPIQCVETSGFNLDCTGSVTLDITLSIPAGTTITVVTNPSLVVASAATTQSPPGTMTFSIRKSPLSCPPAQDSITVFEGAATGSALAILSGLTIPVSCPSTPTVQPFDGDYEGGFEGKGTVAGQTGTAKGDVEFSVSNGTIKVTEPCCGSGSVSSTGVATFGGSVLTGVPCTFDGMFQPTANGGVSASGEWACSAPSVSGSGKWSATRQ